MILVLVYFTTQVLVHIFQFCHSHFAVQNYLLNFSVFLNMRNWWHLNKILTSRYWVWQSVIQFRNVWRRCLVTLTFKVTFCWPSGIDFINYFAPYWALHPTFEKLFAGVKLWRRHRAQMDWAISFFLMLVLLRRTSYVCSVHRASPLYLYAYAAFQLTHTYNTHT